MVRKPPRRHKAREHGREKPTGGRTDVGPYDRGKGESKSKTSASSASRAQTRTLLLKAKDANAAKSPKPARGEMEVLTSLGKLVEGEQIDRALDEVDAKRKVK